MNRRNSMLLAVALLLIGTAVFALGQLKAKQRLGPPGIKALSIPGKLNVNILLPENVLGYQCTSNEPDKDAVAVLPADTSMAQNWYLAGDHFGIAMNVVLMGTDRTSIHKPQYCLLGAGYKIEKTEEVAVPISRPHPYELPVMKITASRERIYQGRPVKVSAIYAYWFVTDDKLTASHVERMKSMARTLITTGKLERWAYVSCLAECEPGKEEMSFARMKQFIAQAVPQFQLVPASTSERAEARQPY